MTKAYNLPAGLVEVVSRPPHEVRRGDHIVLRHGGGEHLAFVTWAARSWVRARIFDHHANRWKRGKRYEPQGGHFETVTLSVLPLPRPGDQP